MSHVSAQAVKTIVLQASSRAAPSSDKFARTTVSYGSGRIPHSQRVHLGFRLERISDADNL